MVTWGYTQIFNSWPLAGISIVHHLESVADIVVVVNHASTDGTADGLTHLQEKYPERIVIITLPSSRFRQEITANLVLNSLPIAEGDWFFAFDADEFLISHLPFEETFHKLSPQVRCVQIPVLNHLSHVDFDAQEVSSFRNLGHRKKKLRTDYDDNLPAMIEEIESLRASYFDYPFADKIIARWRPGLRWGIGAHELGGVSAKEVRHVSEDTLYFAHFPMLDWEHLQLRAENGRTILAISGNLHLGWQSQIVARLQQHHQLEEFWRRNSVDLSADEYSDDLQFDQRLNEYLQHAVDIMQNTDVIHAHAGISPKLHAALTAYESQFNIIDALSDTLAQAETDLRAVKESHWWRLGLRLKSFSELVMRGR